MLSKLMKHEFIASSRFMLPAYAVLAAITLLFSTCVGIFARAGMENASFSVNFFQFSLFSFENGSSTTSGDFLFAIVFGSYIVSIIAIGIVSMVMVVLRFYSSLLGDEGYLTHTLPVSTNQLLLSRLIVHFIWNLISILAILFSCFLVLMTLVVSVADAREISEVLKVFREPKLIDMIVESAICMFFSTASGIMMLYASMALGQLFHKARKAGAVAAYIGLSMVFQLITIIPIGIVFANSDFFYTSSLYNFNVFGITTLIMRISNALSIVFGIGLWFLTCWLMKKKLNLE